MAIKIINGKAVIVPDEQTASSSAGLTFPIPKSTQPSSPQLFTNKDPKIAARSLFDILKGFIPGSEDVGKIYNKELPQEQRMQAATEAMNPFLQMGKFGLNLLKGAAGVIPRIGLSASDLFGGPKTSQQTYGKIPIIGPTAENLIGPQQSYQNTYRQLKQEGAGPVTAAGVSAVQPIMDLLLGKSMLNHGPTLGLFESKKPSVKPVAEVPAPPEPPAPSTPQATVPKPPGYYGAKFLEKQAPTVKMSEGTVPKPEGYYGGKYAMEGSPVQSSMGEPSTPQGGVPPQQIVPQSASIEEQIAQQKANKLAGKAVGGSNEKWSPYSTIETPYGTQRIIDPTKTSTTTIEKIGEVKVGDHIDLTKQVMGGEIKIVGKVLNIEERTSSFGTKSRTIEVQTPDGEIVTKNIGLDEKIDAYKLEPRVKSQPSTPQGGVKGGVPTNQELGMRALERQRQAQMPKPQEPIIPKPEEAKIAKTETQTTELLDKLLRPEKKPNLYKQAVDKLATLNPWRFETGKIESYGPEGKELVTKGRRVNAQAITTAGDLRKVNTELGIPKLKIAEQTNLRDVMEGKAQPANENISQIATRLREVMNKYGQETGSPIIENYYPRRLNEAGRKFYQLPENKEALVSTLMEQNGMNRMEALNLLDRGLKRGSFEFERILPDVPKEFRLDPVEELYRWENEIARRKGIIQEFGPKDEIVNDLISKIGVGDKYEAKYKSDAKAYVDRVAGRVYEQTPLDPVYNFLKDAMVVSKINPLTTVGNELQGHISSYLDYGIKGLTDATFGSKGNKLVSELGLDNLKGKIGDEVQAGSFTSKWLKAVGMEGSEIRGFKRTASSTYSAIKRAFETLKKDPTNVDAKKLLTEHAMFPEDVDLARALMKGEIPDNEMKIGIVEGVRKKMFFNTPGERPAWANTGAGKAAYTFHNYVLSQMQLLSKAPVHRQLAYLMVIAPLAGLPTMLLRRAIQGKPLPKDPLDWYASTSSAGPGTPTDLYQSLAINPTSFITGSFSPIIDMITSKNKLKTAFQHFVPGGNILKDRLFPKKK